MGPGIAAGAVNEWTEPGSGPSLARPRVGGSVGSWG
jgi:hypothetical protein